MKALFIADDAGRGHLVRCGALARTLEGLGWTTRIHTSTQAAIVPEIDVLVLDLRAPAGLTFGQNKVVCIVDLLDTIPGCDLLVCGNAGAERGKVKGLIGPEYALLRHEFFEERFRPRERRGVVDIRHVGGWSARDMAVKMADARIVISYGGMRAQEAACVGTPAVLVPRNPGERLNAQGLMMAGAAIIAAEDDALAMAKTLMDCAPLMEKMGRNGRALVDGKGCQRVAHVIGGLVS